MIQEIRHALRVHIRQPKLALIMIATLALGIAAATSVFTVVRAALLRPLWYPHPEQLVRLFESNPAVDATYFSVSAPNWMDWRARTQTFQDLAALARPQDLNLNHSGESLQITATRISSNLLPLLGVQSMMGRNFSPAADRFRQENSVILNNTFWKTQFGGAESILGRTLVLDDKPFVVVGITPEGFHLPFADAQVYVPLSLTQTDLQRSQHFLRVIGRLKPGLTAQQGLAEMKNIAAAMESQYRDSNLGWSVTERTIGEIVVPQSFRRGLWILFGAVGFVLMIACLNVANLLTARIISRRREISIRRAVGAGYSQLFVQFLTESLFIALVAGAAGIFLASWFVELLRRFGPEIPRLQEIGMDPVVLAFAIVVSCLTVLVFGTMSALQGLRTNVQEDLKEGSQTGTSSAKKIWIRNTLVVIEASMTIVLLIGAGLLIKSFLRLYLVDPGFRPNRVVALKITLPEDKAASPEKIRDFHRRVLEKLQGQPEIQSAGIANQIPFGLGNAMEEFSIEGKQDKSYAAAYRIVSGDYFSAMGIPILRGRPFDSKGAVPEHVIIIDAMSKRRFWPNEDPIAKKTYIKGMAGVWEIQGIVGEVRSFALHEEPLPTLYLSSAEVNPDRSSYLVVRASNDTALLSGTMRVAVREANPDAIIGSPTTMNALVSDSLSEQRFNVWILTLFATVALMLAGVGLYSVIAYSVSQRTHEIGIRMALGARQSDVVLLIVKQGLVLAVAGVSIGILASLGLTRLLTSLLYLVNPTDAVTFQSGALFFLAIALIASYFPARRAAALDPVVALKQE